MCSYAELGTNGKERIDATLRVDKTPSILLKSMVQNVNRRSGAGPKILTTTNLVNWNIVTDEPLRQVPTPSILSKSIDVNQSATRLRRKNSVNQAISSSITLVKSNVVNENVTLQMVSGPSSANSLKLARRHRSGNFIGIKNGDDSAPVLNDQRQSAHKPSAKEKKPKYRESSFSRDLKFPRSHTNSELDGYFNRSPTKPVIERNNSQARLSRNSTSRDLTAKLETSLSNLSSPGNKLFKRDNSSSQPSMVPYSSETSKLNTRSIELTNLKNEQRKQIYALNALMTNLEYENFVEFCRENNIDIKND